MAKAAIAGGATPLRCNLPEEIVVWEILVRLPPKSLLRCRAVCRDWRRATSTRDFLLAHHACQPNLPILYGYKNGGEGEGLSLCIIPFDHLSGLTAVDQLQSIARLQLLQLLRSCDGLLLLYNHNRHYAICNPATRQYAPLRQINDFTVLGMYPHRQTGEYRLLLYPDRLMDDELPAGIHHGCYVFTLGSSQSQQPRHIGWPESEELMFETSVLFRGSLHWYPIQPGSKRGMIMVFDTMAESFRRMHAPDYGSEVWTFKCQIKLQVEEIRAHFQKVDSNWDVLVTSSDDDVLVLVQSGQCLLQLDIDGKLVGTFHHKCLHSDILHLKQSLVLHAFFPALDGYVVNELPFL
uniref:Uncharacterized protein n=1 Tax=Avena sativa TaxID=4498 RepID=A0ACD5XDV4_AVESA